MKLLKSREIEHLISSGELYISGPKGDLTFLDDFRIGLSLKNQFDTLCPNPNIQDAPSIHTEGLIGKPRKRGDWGLCYSNEKVGLGASYLGLLQTRSKYARKGLELMGSSWLVAPGFGQSEPSSIVFEVSFNAEVTIQTVDEFYGFMILFDIGGMADVSNFDYAGRFPFYLHQGITE